MNKWHSAYPLNERCMGLYAGGGKRGKAMNVEYP